MVPGLAGNRDELEQYAQAIALEIGREREGPIDLDQAEDRDELKRRLNRDGIVGGAEPLVEVWTKPASVQMGTPPKH